MKLADANHYTRRSGFPTRAHAEAILRGHHARFIAEHDLSIGYCGGWQVRIDGGLRSGQRFFIDSAGLVTARCYRAPDEWEAFE